ncbi:MAG: zinc-binding alcohol dehydrogenase family protein [Hyphomicrobiales bacterium]
MDALVIEDIQKASLRDVPDLALGPHDVLVDVSFVGLCGSDLNTFLGLNPLVKLPRIPGHEVSGTVLKLGSAAGNEVSVGQNVIFWPYTACGKCTSCRSGRSNACRYNKTLGVQQDGALRSQMVVPAKNVIVDSSLSPQRQALVEPISVGFHAVRRGQIRSEDTVVIIGCGMIGMGAILGASRQGAKVIAVDPIATKRDAAIAMGAQHFTTATDETLLAEISELTSDDGADVVIEAVGLPSTFTGAVDMAAFGGRVVYVGYSKKPVSYQTQLFNLKELDIMGSRNATRDDFQSVVTALQILGDEADQLITKVFPIKEADQALSYWVENRSNVLKLMIEF